MWQPPQNLPFAPGAPVRINVVFVVIEIPTSINQSGGVKGFPNLE